MSEPATTRPAAASALAALLLVEGLAMLVLAVWLAIQALGDPAEHIGGGLFLAVIVAGVALLLAQAGRAMLDGRAWARSASVVFHVLMLGVSLGTWNGGEGPVPLALLLVALAITGLVLSFRGSVTAWLRRE